MAAEAIVDDPVALQQLLHRVESHEFGIGRLSDAAGGVDVDIACAVVEAHVEELLEAHVAGVEPERSCTDEARRRLVIAALHYLVMENDVVPDSGPFGHLDDVAILRWVTRVAQGELPAV